MIQAGLVWAYAVGAGIALGAAHQLRTGATRPYFLLALGYLAVFFGPATVILLWVSGSWGSMHVLREPTPLWLFIALYAGVVLIGVGGFAYTARLIANGRLRWAVAQMFGGYAIFNFVLLWGWDGTGLRRTLSVTSADFDRIRDTLEVPKLAANAADFATSRIALTLVILGVIVLPMLFGMMFVLLRAGLRRASDAGEDVTLWSFAWHAVKSVGVIGFLLLGGAGVTAVGAVFAIWVGSLMVGWIAGTIGGLLVTVVITYAIALRRGGLIAWGSRAMGMPPVPDIAPVTD